MSVRRNMGNNYWLPYLGRREWVGVGEAELQSEVLALVQRTRRPVHIHRPRPG